MHDGCLWLEEPIPITDMVIHQITQLLHTGENPTMAFGGKTGEHDLAKEMKDKFKLAKKSRSYSITSITNLAVKVATHILAGKIMRKCHTDEAQDQIKKFHEVWLLLSIMLVAWELLEDSQFHPVAQELLEVMKFTSLWAAKDPQRVKDNKVFWILMEMNIHMAINRKPWLLPTIFDQIAEYVEFKMDFHHGFMHAQKDPKKKWYDLPYLATEDMIATVLDYWPIDWCTALDLTSGSSNFATKKKKDEATLMMEQLAEKRKKEVEEKTKAENATTKKTRG